MSSVASDHWGGTIYCEVCGAEARTNCLELLDGSEQYVCCDCEFALAWDIAPAEGTEIPLLQLSNDTAGMERLL